MLLYNGQVDVKFRDEGHKYSIDGVPKDGVTSIVGVIDKPALKSWLKDAPLEYLFGTKYVEQYDNDGNLREVPTYDEKKAAVKPHQPYALVELQTFLENAASVTDRKRDKGADEGTIAHDLIEQFLILSQSGAASVAPESLSKPFEGFKRWWDSQTDIAALKMEQIVYSRKFDYCGKFDALLDISGNKVLTDVKTTNYSRSAPNGVYPDHFIQLGGYAQAYEEEFGECLDDLMVLNANKQGKVTPVFASELGLTVEACKEMFRACHTIYKSRRVLASMLKTPREAV